MDVSRIDKKFELNPVIDDDCRTNGFGVGHRFQAFMVGSNRASGIAIGSIFGRNRSSVVVLKAKQHLSVLRMRIGLDDEERTIAFEGIPRTGGVAGLILVPLSWGSIF